MAGVQPADIQWLKCTTASPLPRSLRVKTWAFLTLDSKQAGARWGTAREGSIPINTSGGLKAKGHPVGASGAAQVVEIWKQMRGEAGSARSEQEINLALAHNVGGTGQTCTVHIFERR
jgi:acetyl-CoA C-acetyltransferase